MTLATNGTLSGTPTQIGTFNNITVTASNGTLPNATQTFSIQIAPKQLNVTANAQDRAYGAANPTFTYSVTGFVNSETATIITGALATSAVATSPIGDYPITVGTLAAPNYTISFTGADLTVTTATLNVTANAQNRAYGAANPTLTYNATGFVNGDTASILTGALTTSAAATSPIGDYPITVGTLAAPNYTISFTGANLTVIRANLTVVADNKARPFGRVNPALTFAATGFVNGDTAETAVTGALETTAAINSPLGDYPIMQGTLDAANYNMSFTAGTLTVTEAALEVRWLRSRKHACMEHSTRR